MSHHGDLNSYSQEDPVRALSWRFTPISFGARRQGCLLLRLRRAVSGVLDHGLATPSLVHQVTEADVWHINADEPSVIDYNTEFKAPQT